MAQVYYFRNVSVVVGDDCMSTLTDGMHLDGPTAPALPAMEFRFKLDRPPVLRMPWKNRADRRAAGSGRRGPADAWKGRR